MYQVKYKLNKFSAAPIADIVAAVDCPGGKEYIVFVLAEYHGCHISAIIVNEVEVINSKVQVVSVTYCK